MKHKITEELKKLGIVPAVEDANSLRFQVGEYEVDYVEEDRECLAFLSDTEKSSLYARLDFTVNGEKKPKYKHALRVSPEVGSKEIADWVYRKMMNPERDTTQLENFKKKIQGLGYEWLEQERIINVSPEFEDYGKIKIDSLVINFNDIITDDYFLIQIKTLLDQPKQPQLFLFKTVSISDQLEISEEEFEEESLESIIKRSIMFRYLELGEQASGPDEEKIRNRVEKIG